VSGKVRCGILGTARIARNSHVPAVRRSANAQIVAVASRDAARAEAFAVEAGIPSAYGSYEQLLADPGVDAVINVLPNSMHHEWTLKALSAGKHVLCEKPLAMTAEEASEMFAAATLNGRVLMEAFKHRFHPQLAFARRMIADGAIGDVRSLRCELVYTIQDWTTDSRTAAILGGGSLMDAGCYCTSTMRHILGAEPVAATAMRCMRHPNGVDATFAGLLEFAGGCIAGFLAGMEQPFRGCCEIVGTSGRIGLSNLFGNSTATVSSLAGERTEQVAAPDLMLRQIKHFSRCVLEGTTPEITAADTIGNTATLAALRQAAASGHTITI
jgi:predicted dehydrogenase